MLGPTVVDGSSNLLEGVFSVAYPVGDVVRQIADTYVRQAEAQREAASAGIIGTAVTIGSVPS